MNKHSDEKREHMMNKPARLLASALCLTTVVTFSAVPSLAHTGSQKSPVRRAQAQTVRSSASGLKTTAPLKRDSHSILVTYKKGVSADTAESSVEHSGMDAADSVRASGRTVVKASLKNGMSVRDAVSAMNQKKNVAYAQPNYVYKFAGASSGSSAAEETSGSKSGKSAAKTDPYLKNGQAYQLKTTNAEKAWSFLESRTHGRTTVAVIDTGVDTEHEDLQKNLVTRDGCYTNVSDGNTRQMKDDSGEHGTHVSGIIGMTYGNGKGAAGIASGHHNDLVRVLMIGASSDGLSLSTYDVATALKTAEQAGARVVNMSFGFGTRDRVLEQSLRDAYAHGMTLVAASGNDSNDYTGTPNYEKEVISVNAATDRKQPAYFSNFGTDTDVSAPGFQVLSSVPGNQYQKMDGTSMASPCVAAEAALILDANPDLTPEQVRNIICGTTDSDTFSNYSAYGNIDCLKAVQSAASAGDTGVTSLQVKPSELRLTEGDDYGIDTLVKPENSTRAIAWSSSDNAVASVSSTGVIQAKKSGTAEITASCGGKTASVKVTVQPEKKASSIAITGIPKSHEILLGDISYLSAVIHPLDASSLERYWTSSRPDVIYCDGNTDPYLIARKVGTSTITVRNYDGSVSDHVTLSVKKAPDKIRLTKSAARLKPGKTFRFKALATRNGKSRDVSQQISWSVSGSAAKISQDGTLTARKKGTVYVTASVATLGASRIRSELRAVKKVAITGAAAASSGKNRSSARRTSLAANTSAAAAPVPAAAVINTPAASATSITDAAAAPRSASLTAPASFQSTGNAVEDARQKYVMALNELDSQYAQNKERYNPQVQKEIRQAHDAVLQNVKQIQTARQAADMRSFYGTDLQVYQKLLTITRTIAPESSSLKHLKTIAVDSFQSQMPKNRKKYSSYYWGIIQNTRKSETAALKNASTYSDLMRECLNISSKYNINIQFTDDEESIDINDLATQIISMILSDSANLSGAKPWYSSKSAAKKKTAILKALKKQYRYAQTSPVITKSDKAALARLYRSDVREIRSAIDIEQIRTLRSVYDARVEALTTITDPASKYFISTNAKARLAENIQKRYLALPLNKISKSRREALWKSCENAQETVTSAPNRPEAEQAYKKICKKLNTYK